VGARHTFLRLKSAKTWENFFNARKKLAQGTFPNTILKKEDFISLASGEYSLSLLLQGFDLLTARRSQQLSQHKENQL